MLTGKLEYSMILTTLLTNVKVHVHVDCEEHNNDVENKITIPGAWEW